MSRTPIRFYLSPRASLFLGVLALLGVFAATSRWAPVTHAQESLSDQELSPDATVTPAILLQYASVGSAGNLITISRAPVTTSTGATIYEDIKVQLAVGAAGQITIAAGYPKTVPSPNLLVGAFKAGTYVGPLNVDSGNMGILLTGPGIGQGVTVWNAAVAKGYDPTYTTPGNATFWVGPIANSPIAARLKAAKITSTNWSYGIAGSPNGQEGLGDSWVAGALLGFSQNGSTLTIASFSYYGGIGGTADQNMPTDQFIYTLKP